MAFAQGPRGAGAFPQGPRGPDAEDLHKIWLGNVHRGLPHKTVEQCKYFWENMIRNFKNFRNMSVEGKLTYGSKKLSELETIPSLISIGKIDREAI